MNLQALGKIAVLMGGNSEERPISLNSGRAVFNALKSLGADVIAVDIQGHNIVQLTDIEFDIAFIALHGRGGEDGTIQGLLEWMDKPYTGSGVMASALAMDKWRTKKIWKASGLNTPVACLLNNDTDWNSVMTELNQSVIVKPVREGSSIGMYKARTVQELKESFQKASQYDTDVLAEAYIEGPEFTVAIVSGKPMPAIQLKTSHEFYDYEAKYQSSDTEYVLPSGLSPEKEKELQKLSLRAFHLLGCEGWGRVDVMQDISTKEFFLLEVNTNPGMTDHSLVPMAAKASGLSFPALIVEILRDARERSYV